MNRAHARVSSVLRISIGLLSLGLVGCGHVHLYDAARDTLAQTAVEQLNNADLEELSLDKVKALDAQLEYALTVAGEADAFLLQSDLLQMAASDDKSLADWLQSADERIRGLGFSSRAGVRDFMLGDIDVSVARAGAERALEDLTLVVPHLISRLPDCAPAIPMKWDALQDVDPGIQEVAEIAYESYRMWCQTTAPTPPGGQVAGAWADYEAARLSLEQRDHDALSLKASIDQVKIDLETASQAPRDSATRIAATAARVDTTLQAIRAAETNLGLEVLPDATVDALQIILGQVQGQELADPEDMSQELVTAAHIARAAPALAADMDALINQARQPPVSHLVIELQRQLILAQHAKALRELLVRRVELQKRIYDARVAQASAYRHFVTELCNFAYPDLRQLCDEPFSIDGDGADAKCGFRTPQTTCLLEISWQKALASEGAPKRAVLRAIIALVDAHSARASETTAQLRVNDLYYRETVLASETAVAQWNNLIKVPADQIASFYAAGLRTDDLSDFLVKIVGLVSLAVIGND